MRWSPIQQCADCRMPSLCELVAQTTGKRLCHNAVPPPDLGPRDTAPATKAAILDAARAVVVERGQNYGDVAENFARIARRWHAHLLNRFGIDVPLDPVSVALMMDDVKSARLEHQPDHRDSWVDKAGYAACGGEIAGGAGGKGGR